MTNANTFGSALTAFPHTETSVSILSYDFDADVIERAFYERFVGEREGNPMSRPQTDSTRRAYLRRLGLSGTLGVVAGFSGCTASSDGGNSTAPITVDADETVAVGPHHEYGFEPGTGKPLHVSTGDTVLWVWKSNTHNIVVGDQPDGANWKGTPGGRNDVYDSGYRYHHTFDVPGTYRYWCQPHKAMGMVADIVVEK